MAVGLPGDPALPPSGDGRAPPTLSPRASPTTRRPSSRARGTNWQARELSHAASRLRYPSPRRRLRHPHNPGAPWPQRREHHNDLLPRVEPRRPRRPKPSGQVIVAHPGRAYRITSRFQTVIVLSSAVRNVAELPGSSPAQQPHRDEQLGHATATSAKDNTASPTVHQNYTAGTIRNCRITVTRLSRVSTLGGGIEVMRCTHNCRDAGPR